MQIYNLIISLIIVDAVPGLCDDEKTPVEKMICPTEGFNLPVTGFCKIALYMQFTRRAIQCLFEN